MIAINPVKCPNCGNKNLVRIIDKKFLKKIVRFLTFTSRLHCKKCNITWRRNTPHEFSPLKKRHRYFKYNVEEGELSIIISKPLSEKFCKRAISSLEHAIRKNRITSKTVCLQFKQRGLIRNAFLNTLDDFETKINERNLNLKIITISKTDKERLIKAGIANVF